MKTIIRILRTFIPFRNNPYLALALCAPLLAGCFSPVPSNHMKGELGGVPFDFTWRKQVTVTNMQLSVISGSNSATLSIGGLVSVNDPQVIDRSYAGQVALEKARWEGLNITLEKMVQGGGKVLMGGAQVPGYSPAEIADIERQEKSIVAKTR